MAEPNKDYTPIQVVRQGVDWILKTVLREYPTLVLDPCAGGGVFGKVLADLVPRALRWGIDVEDGCWTDHYHWSRVGRAQDVCQGLKATAGGKYAVDLVITNPDFGLVYEMLPVWLELAPVVVLYCKDDLGQRSTTDGMYGTIPTPCGFGRIPGAVFHRLDETGRPKSDSRSYGWWIWVQAGEFHRVQPPFKTIPPGYWATTNLPLLDGKARKITFEETPEGCDVW